MASPTPTEHAEQVALFKWWQYYSAHTPFVMFSIPNGGKRNIITAKNMKDEGQLAGVPDIFLAYARDDYSGLFVEMKRRKGGVVSDAQKAIMAKLRANGYCVVVCKGCEEAISAIKDYITGQSME